MPLTLLEAMSYGKACVVSDIEENLNVAKDADNSYTFNKSNVNSLTSVLEGMINNKDIDSEKTIELVKEKYSWKKVFKQYLLCLESL